ncbi:MAG: DUF2721 domain-containing protein [Tepidisphaeraceae bacterium]|jgi:hypothetical protein
MYDWSKIISAGVGPIIVISACGLLCLAFYNRLAAVVARLRSLHREQLVEADRLAKARQQGNTTSLDIVRAQELLGMLKVQTDHIARRARLIRATLQCLLITIGCLAFCSLALGLSALFPHLIIPASTFFILGMLTMVLAVVLAMAELHQALDPVDLEARFVTELSRDLASEYAEHTA